jgi:hypothetical protein
MLACLLVQMLNRIGVELLVLPAVPELMDTWRGAFGFQPLNSHQKKELTKLNLMAFPGTSLLHKFLPRHKSISSCGGKVDLNVYPALQQQFVHTVVGS